MHRVGEYTRLAPATVGGFQPPKGASKRTSEPAGAVGCASHLGNQVWRGPLPTIGSICKQAPPLSAPAGPIRRSIGCKMFPNASLSSYGVGDNLFDRLHRPEPVPKIMGVLHGHTFVGTSYVLGAHQRDSNSQSMLFTLGEDSLMHACATVGGWQKVRGRARAVARTTTVFAGTSSMWPPGDVRPGAMMFAPESTKRMAPRSTRNFGRISGNWCSMRRVGTKGPSRI